MFGYLILLFTILPALELAVLIHVGSYIGTANTIMIIIMTGVAGAYLARIQGFFVIQNIQRSLNEGLMPTEDMLDGLMIFVGGIVLLTPGFITDAIGFFLLIPLTRSLIKAYVRRHIQASVHVEQSQTHQKQSTQRLHDNADDAEFYE